VESNDPRLHRDVLDGIATGLKGRRRLPMPHQWQAAWAKIATDHDPVLCQLANEVGVVFEDERAIQELQQLVQSDDSEPQARHIALAALVANRTDGLARLLQRLIDDKELAAQAVRGLAAINDKQTPRLLLDRYPAMNPTLRRQAVSTLASRAAFAQTLLVAVEAKKIPRGDIGAFDLRQMWSLDDASLQKKIRQLWPKFLPASGEKAAAIHRYQKILTKERLLLADAA